MLFSDIEQDLVEKERFLKDQSGKIDEMVKMYHTMLAKISVLRSAATFFNLQIAKGDGIDVENFA